MPRIIEVFGATAQSGAEWVNVRVGERSAWVLYHLFHGNGREAVEALRRSGVVIIGPKMSTDLLNEVNKIDHFPRRVLIDQIGWNGGQFALPDGTIMSPQDQDVEAVLFDKLSTEYSSRGSFSKWKKLVATPLVGQSIYIFAVCHSFVAPLLDIRKRESNFGFELVGSKGAGKSTIQFIAASVVGGPVPREPGAYVTSFNATPAGIEQLMTRHNDLPMLLEEANLYQAGESRRTRSEHFMALCFRLADGADKRRFGSGTPMTSRFTYLTSSNEPHSTLVEDDTEAVRAAADRLITIMVPASNDYGCFDFLPEGFTSSSKLARTVLNAARQNYGHAIRKFLEKLVEERARNEKALIAKIEKLIAHFCQKIGIDGNNGSELRVAEAFGYVYAAGELAKEYGVLPRAYKCGNAVEHCYRLRHVGADHRAIFIQTLHSLVEGEGTVDLDHLTNEDDGSSDMEKAKAYLKTNKGGRELWIRERHIHELIPNWDRVRNVPDIVRLLKRDGSHKKVKRQIGAEEKSERVYCFDLTKIQK